MGDVRKELIYHLYNRPMMLTLEDLGREDVGKQVYDALRAQVLRDTGDPEHAETVSQMAVKGLEKVQKTGLIPMGIIKQLTAKGRGSYKFQFAYRPGYGPAKDHSLTGEMVLSKTTSKHPGISFNFGIRPELPRSSEFEYDLAGNQWEFNIATPKYELPGGLSIPAQNFGNPNITVKNPLLTGTPSTMRKIHQMEGVPPIFYRDNARRKEEARVQGIKEPAQWKRHKSNPEWMVLSPGRGRHNLANLEQQAKLSLSDPAAARIRWAFTGVVRIGTQTVQVRQGQPVTRVEYDAFYRGQYDTVQVQ